MKKKTAGFGLSVVGCGNGRRQSQTTSHLFITMLFLATTYHLQPTTSYAEPTGAAFIKVNPSPRSYALAGANIGSSFGAEGIFSNPANVGSIDQRYELFSSYS